MWKSRFFVGSSSISLAVASDVEGVELFRSPSPPLTANISALTTAESTVNYDSCEYSLGNRVSAKRRGTVSRRFSFIL